MNRSGFKKLFALALAGYFVVGNFTLADDTDSVSRPGGFQFDRTISRQALENYLSRSITMEGLLNGRGDLNDNIRMLKSIGAKYIGRALCLWNAENDFSNNLQRAHAAVPQVLVADPDIVLEACVFETVTPKINQIAVPDWVFTAFGLPVEKRNFRFDGIIYPNGQRRMMGPGAQVPDESRIETQMWFYYQAVSYIDAGCEAIHFGQVEIMNRNDPDNTHWAHLLGMVRAYAATHARRHMVICDGHVPTGGLMHDGNPLLDFNAFPLRIMETPDKPHEAILKSGFSDGLYNRSKGGKTFSGWTCDHLPYFVEFDNYGVSHHPGQPNTKGEFNWIWGYDEITWFAHEDQAYRSNWLQYAWNWVRSTDTNGWLEMPGSRTAVSPDTRWYFANDPSPAVPTGLGDEEAIRAVWAKDAAQLVRKTSAGKRSPDQVLLVYNVNSPVSKTIADDYAAKRHVTNILSVRCKDSAVSTENESIPLDDYRQSIEAPVRDYLAVHTNIDFIVLTKGVPIRITGSSFGSSDQIGDSHYPDQSVYHVGRPSVDSTLAALDYTNLPGALVINITGSGGTGFAYSNRFWNATEPFSHAKFGGYLVTRLDAYTQTGAEALVTQSLEAEQGLTNGKVLFDVQPIFGLGDKASEPSPITGTLILRESSWDSYNADMRHAHDIMVQREIPDELDLSETFVGQRTNLLGYFSWGSNDARYSPQAYQTLFFAPGSISDTAVSTSARTFLPTHGGQSLLIDLIAHGLTCGKGYVNEPLLQAIASPTILMDRYTSGRTMAESFYAASRFVGWEDVVVGDPLCCPYAK